MNIITLFESLKLKKGNSFNFSSEKIAEIEQLAFEQKRHNPEISEQLIAELIRTLRYNPEEFNFLANYPLLYNLFAQTRYPRDVFADVDIEPEKMKVFLNTHFHKELETVIFKHLSHDRFDDLVYLMKAQRFFPDQLMTMVRGEIQQKLDRTISKLQTLAPSQLSEVRYFQDGYFYQFLSFFNSAETDKKVAEILRESNRIVIQTKGEYGDSAFYALSNYQTNDENLRRSIANYQQKIIETVEKPTPTWRYVLIVFLLIVKVILLANKCSQ